MKNSIFICFAICIITLSSCINSGKGHQVENKKHKASDTITWEILNIGNLSSVTEAKQMLINNAVEFSNIWQQTFHNVMIPIPEAPKVNFTQNKVLVAYMGKVTTGGHKIAVQSVTNKNDTLFITIKHLKPDSKCMVTQAIENPYTFILLEQVQTDKAEFKILAETVPCN